jgi:hypothetical protein
LAFELVSCVIGDLQFEKDAVTGIAKPDRSAVDDLIKRVGLQQALATRAKFQEQPHAV